MAFTIAGGLRYVALMLYVNSSQQLFQEASDLGDIYAILFGAAAALSSATTLTNARLVKRIRMEWICTVSVSLLIVRSLIFAAVVFAFGIVPPLWRFMAANCPALFLLGLTFGRPCSCYYCSVSNVCRNYWSYCHWLQFQHVAISDFLGILRLR